MSRLPSGEKRGRSSPVGSSLIFFASPPASGTSQMCDVFLFASRSTSCAAKATHLPSGEGTGSATRLRAIMSSKVKGCLDWARQRELETADRQKITARRNRIGPPGKLISLEDLDAVCRCLISNNQFLQIVRDHYLEMYQAFKKCRASIALKLFEIRCRKTHESPPVITSAPGLRSALSTALLRLRNNAQVRLGRLPAAGIFLLRLFVAYRSEDDDIIALLPVHGRRDFVLGGELHGINHAQHLIEVAAGAHGITEHQLDFLVGADHKHGAHGGIIGCGAAFTALPRVGRQHAVELGDLQLRIPDHWIGYFMALRLLDVARP